MKIVCLSDTHTYGPRIAVPDGDLLIHAGDHTFRGEPAELHDAFGWLESLPHKYKVVVAGNHDFSLEAISLFEKWSEKWKAKFLTTYPSVTYLEDSIVEIEGVKIYGSPWQPWFHDWAFNFPNPSEVGFESAWTAAQEAWEKIPLDTNILITHGPPHGILDRTVEGDLVGCPMLRKRVDSLHALQLHVFGHIHESYGQTKITFKNGFDPDFRDTLFVNASINTRQYNPTNQPIVVNY